MQAQCPATRACMLTLSCDRLVLMSTRGCTTCSGNSHGCTLRAPRRLTFRVLRIRFDFGGLSTAAYRTVSWCASAPIGSARGQARQDDGDAICIHLSLALPSRLANNLAHVSKMTIPDFEISQSAKWTPYCERPDRLCSSLGVLLARVRNAEGRSAEDGELQERFAAMRTLTHYQYIAEACEGEDVGTHTVDEAQAAIAVADPSSLNFQQREGYNMSRASQSVLGQGRQLSEEAIAELHRIAGQGVLPEHAHGTYRKNLAIGYGVMYAHPHAIQPRIRALVRTILEWKPGDAAQACKRAAYFMAEFLHIHPFRDGNGRVARICVSWLMEDFAVVPISLCVGRESRKHLIDCLLAAQMGDCKPRDLALLVLWCARNTSANAAYVVQT
jgi:fido (protein-threonine AMPylation protein)